VVAIFREGDPTGEVGEFLQAAIDHAVVKDRAEKSDDAGAILEDEAAHVLLARPAIVEEAPPEVGRNRRVAKDIEERQHGLETLRRGDLHVDHDTP